MANPQSEQSMDEILASIRRIISEDDEPSAQEAAPAASATATDVADGMPEAVIEEPVVELPEEAVGEDISKLQAALQAADFNSEEPTEPEFEEPQTDFQEDAVENMAAAPEVVSEPEFDPMPQPESIFVESTAEPVLDLAAEAEIVAVEPEKPSFATLGTGTETGNPDVSTILSGQATAAAAGAFGALAENVRIADGEGVTLESLAERMLEPMLREWLDVNLPRVVEEKVEERSAQACPPSLRSLISELRY